MTDDRVRMERDERSGIARITLDNPERKNAYDPAMRQQLGAYLDELAYDDDIKVVILRGEGGVFSTGADMDNAYAWYGDAPQGRRQQRRQAAAPEPASPAARSTARPSTSTTSSSATRRSPWPRSRASPSAAASSWRSWPTSPWWPTTPSSGCRPPASSARRSARCTSSSTASARCSPAACCSPATPSRPASSPTSAVFTEVADDRRRRRPRRLVGREGLPHARRRDRDGQGGVPPRRAAVRATRAKRSSSHLLHAYGTNLQFGEGEFNFVKARAEHGTKEAFDLRDAHFEVPEP